MTHEMRDGSATGRFDVALVERPSEDGLTAADCTELFARLDGDEAYPVEIGARTVDSTAMGFVTRSAAKAAGFELECLRRAVADILDDMSLETEDGSYELCGLRVNIVR